MILNYVINMHSFCYCGPSGGTQVRDTVSMRSRSHRSGGLPVRAGPSRAILMRTSTSDRWICVQETCGRLCVEDSLVIMVFDFSCQEILNETIEELAELSLSLETLFESSYEDVVWFLRLVGGNVIMDHRDTFKDDLFSFHQGKRHRVSHV